MIKSFAELSHEERSKLKLTTSGTWLFRGDLIEVITV